jgi:Spy/CpxP family protein refolding chaperone
MTHTYNLNGFSIIVAVVTNLCVLIIMAITSSPLVSAEEVSKHHSTQDVPSTLTRDEDSSDFEVIQTELSKINKNTDVMSEASSKSSFNEADTNNALSAEVMDEMNDKQQSKKMMMKKEHHSALMKKKMGMMMTMMGRKPSAMIAQENDIEDLPGDSNAPHLYHLGENEFFLDHVNTISLEQQQTQQLDKIRQAWISHNEQVTKNITELEEKLWLLTAEGKPDANKIEAQIRHISKLQSNLRIDFIRSVGKAVSILTEEQIKALVSSNPTDS